MTETEWQELSDFLAREVMGYYTWEELKALRLEGWQLDASHSNPNPPVMLFWWIVEGEERSYPVIKMEDWQPHNNIAQAMLVLKTLLAKIGPDVTAEISMHRSPSRCRVTIQNWVKSPRAPAMFVRSPYADNEMQAICLAAKEWCDVQTA